MNKKTKLKVRVIAKKTRSLAKKINVKVSKTVKSIKKEWKKEKPRRDDFKKELKVGASKMFDDAIKIGKDVAKVIKKDIRDINNK